MRGWWKLGFSFKLLIVGELRFPCFYFTTNLVTLERPGHGKSKPRLALTDPDAIKERQCGIVGGLIGEQPNGWKRLRRNHNLVQAEPIIAIKDPDWGIHNRKNG